MVNYRNVQVGQGASDYVMTQSERRVWPYKKTADVYHFCPM